MLSRSIRLSKQLMPISTRMFSSNVLLVQLPGANIVPSEYEEGFPLTNHLDKVREMEYEAYNDKCKNDLQ